MQHGSDGSSVLLVTASEKAARYMRELLPPDHFLSPQTVSGAGEAKRILIDTPKDIVIIDTPLCDEFGTEFAVSLADRYSTGVLVFVRQELYEQVSYELEPYGIFTLAKPIGRQSVLQALRLLTASLSKLRVLEQKTWSMEEKMREIRLVNRAKCLLIEQLKMSEHDAHRYIEKNAMDRCVKRGEIAVDIIKMYGQ